MGTVLRELIWNADLPIMDGSAMKSLLAVMRLFHYMLGITAPKPQDERKILALWILIIVGLCVLGLAFAFFMAQFVFR